MSAPTFPAQWQGLVDQAATALRALALDESAKEKFCNDPLLRSYMHKVSQRYVAGQTVAEALRDLVHVRTQQRVVAEFFLGRFVERQRAQRRRGLIDEGLPLGGEGWCGHGVS